MKLELIHGEGSGGTCQVPMLTVIEGSRTARNWFRLTHTPTALDQEEFELFTDVVFKDLLTPSDCMALIEERISHRARTSGSKEARLLNAIVMNDTEEINRLGNMLARMRELGLHVV